MGDFHQDGPIATFHDLDGRSDLELSDDLTRWSSATPVSVLVPALASELDGAALPAIIEVLAGVKFVDEVIIGLDRADSAQFDRALSLVSTLPMRHRVIWNDGPRVDAVRAALSQDAAVPTERGKGHNVWHGLGFFLGAGRSAIVALHDADILTYSTGMLARLVYPVAHPAFGYTFSKGYYFRADGERLNGRVARLLVAPLLRALRETLGPSDHLEFLAAFRYPLAGESAMHASVAKKLRIPWDWGLEIGMLFELYRTEPESSVCQVEVADAYDHRHHGLSVDDPRRGLHRMAIEISRAFYRRLSMSGEELSPRIAEALGQSFARNAAGLARRYEQDAEMNGFEVDLAGDTALIELFTAAVLRAAEQHLGEPGAETIMPSWSTISDNHPDLLRELVEAVEADNLD